ncbi:hypothetical protein BDM02DRAFT_3068932, partial [Thelephora ganbajun]
TVTKPATVVENMGATSQDDDTGMCLICAEPMRYYSVSECNHRTCHVCALRLRALWKKHDCSFCKEPQPSLIFTTSPTAKFESFRPNDIPCKDARLSIFFETQEMMEDTLILLRFNCPDGNCDYIASGWSDLKLHVRGIHGNLMCELCIRTKKMFAHEHTTYPPNLLPYHLPSILSSIQARGTPQKPKGLDEVHPMCEFCRECFPGDDELYAHIREKHEECFLCKRDGTLHKIYENYDALETHFMKGHHPCKRRTCLEQKFVVFATEMDLKGHMVEVHGAEMSSRDRRDVRRLETDFEYEDHGGYRRGVGGNRERDRNPPPQRQPPNVRRRELGTGLTADTPTPSSSAPVPSVNIPTPPPDADPLTVERYNTLYTKVASTAANPSRAVGAVELSLRSYRNSESTARDLISSIWNVLDQNLDTSATFVNLIVDLLEEDKKKDLLGAWNGFKIEQRGQFPELVPTSTGTEYAGIASGRVLNAKHQTSRSSRPRRQVLDRVAAAASSSPWPQQQSQPTGNHFPTLASTSRLPPKQTPAPSRPQQKSTTPWTSNGPGSSSGFRPKVQQPVSVSKPQPGTTVARPLSKSAFPELPTVAPNKPPKEFISGNKSLKNILGDTLPAQSVWGQGPSTQLSSPPLDLEPEPTNTRGRKGKGKQKQTLFTLGSFPT